MFFFPACRRHQRDGIRQRCGGGRRDLPGDEGLHHGGTARMLLRQENEEQEEQEETEICIDAGGRLGVGGLRRRKRRLRHQEIKRLFRHPV